MRHGLYAELIGLWGLVPLALGAGRPRGGGRLRGRGGARRQGDGGGPGIPRCGGTARVAPGRGPVARCRARAAARHRAGTPRARRAGPEASRRRGRAGGLLLVYATVSVSAQELLFSSFFFWRYRDLTTPPRLEALNVVAFGVAHLVYGSWVSVGLSMLGRVVLVRVYRRHGSLEGVWLLHLAFGTLVFLVGLGPYFYRPLAAGTAATGR